MRLTPGSADPFDTDPLDADPFDPADATWSSVSVKLAAMRRLALVTAGGVLGLLATLATGVALSAPAGVVVVIVTAAALVAGWRIIGRGQRAWGYTERADDLLIRRGVAFRQIVVVPYGRMQFVDVTDGPLQRWFGLATVQLHTAAAKTDAHIPGLAPGEAARLRDRLAARGESRAAGL